MLLLPGALLLPACAHYPTGPSVLVLPGSSKTFSEFRFDDAVCRDWAGQQSGATPRQAAAENGVGAAAVGTAVGAAAGAAIGAAAGDPGAGAAVGAGSGLLLGSAAGAQRAEWAGGTLQRRYDDAYLQCMYANGNQIPLPADAFGGYAPGPHASRPVPPASRPDGPRAGSRPPPPPGAPPPPPPDA
jgi:hypothetical protein